MDQQPEIAVIAELPSDLRQALAQHFTLVDHPLEGKDAVAMNTLPTHLRAIATRAVLGVPPGLVDCLPNLGLVLSLGAGVDRVDVASLNARNIELAHTPDQFTEDVADFALGLIYASRRRIVEADRFARGGAWLRARFPNSHRVSTCRVGIVGMGRIGMRIATKCSALGMKVGYFSRTERRDCSYPFHADLVELARASDVLVLACAATGQTRGIVDRSVLAALGPEGTLVNIARGSVVDEEALIKALQDGTLGGAALDVFASEPDFDPRLRSFENVIVTPHAASFTFEARQAVNEHLVAAAKTFFASASATLPSMP
jgi:lactate dehydrogenase-like 2-hydroxyacid dehydrogenase